MLVKCPECDLQVSDKALTCPHCGYPLKSPPRKKRRPNSPHHMRLPNGFGQISKINGQNLRNPYRVMVPVGKTSEGKPISKILKPKGYFPTYNEAYAALVEYNRNPYDLKSDMTVKELYETWTKKAFGNFKANSSIGNIKTAWNYCSAIYGMAVRDIRARHLKYCIQNGEYKGRKTSLTNQNKIKYLFNQMFDYALEYELIDKNYARTFSQNAKVDTKHHIIFTKEELDVLWNNLDIPYVDVLIIQCYTGWRPQELGFLELDNINLEEGLIVGGMKTDSGKDRVVPIHSKIMPLIRARYDCALKLKSKYLFNCVDTQTYTESKRMSYAKYYIRFKNIIEKLDLNPEHKPHDGRKTFITMAKEAKVDEYAIKYIVGHTINDITEAVYTDRTTEWLKEEIEKI